MEKRYSSNLSLNLALDEVGDQRNAISPWDRANTLCTGGLVGPRVGLEKCGIPRPHGHSTPDCPAPSELLYRLRYRGSLFKMMTMMMMIIIIIIIITP